MISSTSDLRDFILSLMEEKTVCWRSTYYVPGTVLDVFFLF